jgi:hypothetical protein
MKSIRRDGRDDTGEQDVQELRRRFAGGFPAPADMPDHQPHVRDKEDVPHEGSLADFYGLEDDDTPSLQEVKDELSALVDEGELCMGWDAEEQAFVYWLREEPELAEEPEPSPERPRRSRRKARRRMSAPRRVLLTLAASVAPFLIGMVAEASMDMHYERTHPDVEPDMADAEASTTGSDIEPQTATVALAQDYRPTAVDYANSGRHAAPTTSPNVEKSNSYVGKHRKEIGTPISKLAEEGHGKKAGPKHPHLAAGDPKKPHPADSPGRKKPPRQKPHNVVEHVVSTVLGPVEALLG